MIPVCRLRIHLLFLLLFPPLAAYTQSAKPPHGTVQHFTLPPGSFYPGTPHPYAIYLPAQADPNTPLPYTVWFDGSSFLGANINTPAILDRLIAEHSIPPSIGIFVDPGVLPAIDPTRQNRYERSFEYDSLSPRFSAFLLQELIPAVAKQHPLSTSPDDHALAGISTGAIAAFMAAWNRPDQFHRVLSFIGTYVAMRGGETVSTLIRKSEPRPLRIWLEDGDADHLTPAEPYGTFYAGSWPIANRVLYDALQFQGYDSKLTIGPGGHDMKLGTQLLPDALRWLWRDYPQPITAHPPAALHAKGWDTRGSIWATITAPNDWQQVPLGNTHPRLLSTAGNGDLWAAEGVDNLLRVTPQGTFTSLRREASGSFAAGLSQELYLADLYGHRILRQQPGSPAVPIATGIDASHLIVSAAKHLYFLETPTTSRAPRLGMLDLEKPASAPQYIRLPMADPSGLALSPDQAMLVVTDATHRAHGPFSLPPMACHAMENPSTAWNPKKNPPSPPRPPSTPSARSTSLRPSAYKSAKGAAASP